MLFEYQPSEVFLSDIDSGNETFRITTNSSAKDLVSAMDRVGLTSPPILKTSANGYVVICGFRRIAAARSLGWDSIFARILPEEASSLECALLAITENSIERPLNLIETSRALSLLSSLIDDTSEVLEAAEKTGLPGNIALFKKILPLCKLPQSIQEGILSGELALPSVQLLSRLPDETSLKVAEFLKKLKLSLHKQRELIDIVIELSKIEDSSIDRILSSPEICRVLNDPEMELPRKSGKIREYLRKRRYPHLTRAQEKFNHLMGNLKLGEHVSLKSPPGFESNRYTIALSFESLPELKKQIETLSELENNSEFIHLVRSRDPDEE